MSRLGKILLFSKASSLFNFNSVIYIIHYVAYVVIRRQLMLSDDLCRMSDASDAHFSPTTCYALVTCNSCLFDK